MRASSTAHELALRGENDLLRATNTANELEVRRENDELGLKNSTLKGHCQRLQSISEKSEWDQATLHHDRLVRYCGLELKAYASRKTSVAYEDIFTYSHSRSSGQLKEHLPTFHSFLSEVVAASSEGKNRTPLEINRLQVMVSNLLLSFANKKYQSEWGLLSSRSCTRRVLVPCTFACRIAQSVDPFRIRE